MIASQISRDPKQPSLQARLPAKARQVLIRAQKAFLGQIVSLLRIPQQHEQETVHTPLVPAHDRIKFFGRDLLCRGAERGSQCGLHESRQLSVSGLQPSARQQLSIQDLADDWRLATGDLSDITMDEEVTCKVDTGRKFSKICSSGCIQFTMSLGEHARITGSAL